MLDLSDNQLENFPDNLDLERLDTLDLSNNQLTSFPDDLYIPNLLFFDLSDNQIDSKSEEAIWENYTGTIKYL